MRKFFFIISLGISVCVNAQIEKVIPPKPTAFYAVVDNTNTLTNEQIEALNQKLTHYKDSTSNEIAVVLINSLDDYPIEDVAIRILRNWGVGGKEHNNGVVLLVAKNDKKVRIETGYGLEGAIPDITAKSIIDNEITPNFREGNFYRGLDEATNEIIKAAAGEYKAPEGYNRGRRLKTWQIFLFVIFIWIILGAIGRGGRGGGGYASRRGYRNWGGPIWWGGGGLSSGGGGWSGGGGGGFGGFGGGSGGGGGASGSW
ncbi:MAG TPA: TPM domain-containing protein [Chitinophagaceae bacterium]|jgi:uncharacterized protein|nr:TPM domain-containing protein [Chitinophagaceae bacterium]